MHQLSYYGIMVLSMSFPQQVINKDRLDPYKSGTVLHLCGSSPRCSAPVLTRLTVPRAGPGRSVVCRTSRPRPRGAPTPRRCLRRSRAPAIGAGRSSGRSGSDLRTEGVVPGEDQIRTSRSSFGRCRLAQSQLLRKRLKLTQTQNTTTFW